MADMKRKSSADPSVAAAALARILGDPLRLTILRRLMEGPAAVAELVTTSGEPQSKVSNHLAILRDRRLVSAHRQGRQTIYDLRNAAAAQLVESLLSITGAPSAPAPPASLALARTCYDHLAGKLGVAICDALISHRAIVQSGHLQRDFELGTAGPAIFGRLGVNCQQRPRGRRRYAIACLDWTERRPHLGGWLGAQLCQRALGAGMVVRNPRTRAVSLPARAERALKTCLPRFALDVSAAATNKRRTH